MPPLTAAKEASLITRLPTGRRTELLNKISANANAPGGARSKTNGRPMQAATQRMAGTMGIYPIESNRTGTLAYSVGGATPATIAVASGTPATTPIASNELDPVTWAAPGTYDLSVTVAPTLYGNARLAVT